MPLFTHSKTGERVIAPLSHPEGARLAADPVWDASDDETPTEPTPEPAPRRRSRTAVAGADGAVSGPDGDGAGSGTDE